MTDHSSVGEKKHRYTIDDLLYLMQRLRDPENGCPWDLKQTPQTIINYSIEEVYELAEIIENDPGNTIAFKDELGDVLFQVIFFSQLADDNNDFCFADVASHLCEKMIRRHPHVFHDGHLYPQADKTTLGADQQTVTESDVKANWDAIKHQEKQKQNPAKAERNLFADIPVQLPALLRATKIQKRAAAIGLDWNSVPEVREKLSEELQELDSAMAGQVKPEVFEQVASEQAASELGDVLFTVVNLARHMKLNPEQLLRRANEKFMQRASQVDEMIHQAGVDAKEGLELSAEELDKLWQKAKRKEVE